MRKKRVSEKKNEAKDMTKENVNQTNTEEQITNTEPGDQGKDIKDTESKDENSPEIEEEKDKETSENDKALEEIEELKKQLAEKEDKYLRLTAEFDNYRRRTLKEKMELTKSAGESILVNVLPVVDDFERALEHMSDAKDLESVKTGITLIYNKFSEFLKQNGISPIDAKGKDFDTDLHEAVTKIPASEEKLKGKVVDEIQKGYMLNEKVIRFSKVVIGE